jgi:hypothetical protein
MAATKQTAKTKQATSKPASTPTAPAAVAATLTCPECGKTFTRAAALGAHRKMTHGIAGTSANATSNRARVASKKRTTASTRRRSAASVATNGTTAAVDRDALLRTLFPNGIPPRQDVVGAVNEWLNEAERLARTR